MYSRILYLRLHRHKLGAEFSLFFFFNLSIFQLSDIEEWMDRDTDQHMLQLDVLLVNAAAHRYSE